MPEAPSWTETAVSERKQVVGQRQALSTGTGPLAEAVGLICRPAHEPRRVHERAGV